MNTLLCDTLARGECKGQMNSGQQDREPLRGKFASERVSEREGCQRFSEVFRGFQRFSEAFRDFSEVLSDFPLRGRFPSQRLSVL